MGWRDLPAELIHEVARHLDRHGLRSLRLVQTSLADIVTPKLFETVHISPNAWSFRRASNIAERPELAKHVRRLVYHVGTLDASYANNFPTFREEVLDQRPPPISDLILPNISEDKVREMYDNYLDEVLAQQEFGLRNERQALHDLFNQFSKLEFVTSVLDEYSPFGPPDGYIERRTGMPTSIDDAPHSERLLGALTDYPNLPIKHVALDVLGWYVFRDLALENSSLHPPLVATLLTQRLRTLHLGLYNSELVEMKNPERALGYFHLFLSGTQQTLTSLSLDFDELPYDDTDDQKLVQVPLSIFNLKWPNLTSLSLRGIVDTEPHFVRFLAAHASTLRHLSLADIQIVNTVSSTSPSLPTTTFTTSTSPTTTASPPPPLQHPFFSTSPGSIITFFQTIHSLHHPPFSPHSVHLSGNFTNRHTEAWYVGNTTSQHPSLLRVRLENFLCRRGPSPFPPWHEYLELQRPRYEVKARGLDVQAQVEEKPVREEWADESWEWCPELLGG